MKILFEGPCAYVRVSLHGYEIVVHSTNNTTHVIAGHVKDEAKAERICRRLNAYPQQARNFHGLG